jgi:hypothetical protein
MATVRSHFETDQSELDESMIPDDEIEVCDDLSSWTVL